MTEPLAKQTSMLKAMAHCVCGIAADNHYTNVKTAEDTHIPTIISLSKRQTFTHIDQLCACTHVLYKHAAYILVTWMNCELLNCLHRELSQLECGQVDGHNDSNQIHDHSIAPRGSTAASR